ncbi:hypothetical protein [Magnetococcus sp. PR-3]|uniref:hypothetical protein n=1 Tax=Magnetococcus sp. PR-3 TaxID=3120355 RepID=UPI002FCE4E8E
MCQVSAGVKGWVIRDHKRLKLWEMDERFHCPVIGTCLTMQELRSLTKGFHQQVDESTDFEVHVTAVRGAKQGGRFAKKMQKLFDRKYAASITRIGRDNDIEMLSKHWREALTTGRVAGPLWAIVTHTSVDQALLERMYGDIHMLSHLQGSYVRTQIRQDDQLQRQVELSRDALKEAKVKFQQALDKRNGLIDGLQEEVQTLRQKLNQNAQPVQVVAHTEDEEMALVLQQTTRRNERLEQNNRDQSMLIIQQRDQLAELQWSMEEMRTEQASLERHMQQ